MQQRRAGIPLRWLAGLRAQLVFGGVGEGGHLDDVWVFNTAQAGWTAPSVGAAKPRAREMHSGTMLDATTMLVYGGRDAAGRCGWRCLASHGILLPSWWRTPVRSQKGGGQAHISLPMTSAWEGRDVAWHGSVNSGAK